MKNYQVLFVLFFSLAFLAPFTIFAQSEASSTVSINATSTLPVITATNNLNGKIAAVKVSEAVLIMKSGKNLQVLLDDIKKTKNPEEQKRSMDKYLIPLAKKNKLTQDQKSAINYFIVYGTKGNYKLSINERADVIKAYKNKYKKLPITEKEWSTVLNIAKSKYINKLPGGLCLVRDSFTDLPGATDQKAGKGYALMIKHGVNTITDLRKACTLDDYKSLMASYCKSNINKAQMEVATVNLLGGSESTGCGDFGCGQVGCQK
ncbi:MAG: hypothetical protein WCG01_03805 [bacterium]